MSVATACARTWEKYTAGENIEDTTPDSGYSTEMLPDKDMDMELHSRQGNLSTEAPTPSLDKSLEVSQPSVVSSLVEEAKQAADTDPLAKAAALMLRKNPNGRIRRVVDRFTPASLDLFYNQVMEEMQGGKYECDWVQHLSEKTVADLERKFQTGDGITPVRNWKPWRSWNILEFRTRTMPLVGSTSTTVIMDSVAVKTALIAEPLRLSITDRDCMGNYFSRLANIAVRLGKGEIDSATNTSFSAGEVEMLAKALMENWTTDSRNQAGCLELLKSNIRDRLAPCARKLIRDGKDHESCTQMIIQIKRLAEDHRKSFGEVIEVTEHVNPLERRCEWRPFTTLKHWMDRVHREFIILHHLDAEAAVLRGGERIDKNLFRLAKATVMLQEDADISEIRGTKRKQEQNLSQSKVNKKPAGKECYYCGNPHHPEECKSKLHPQANKNPNIRWVDSDGGKLWKLHGVKFGHKNQKMSLPRYWMLESADRKAIPYKEPELQVCILCRDNTVNNFYFPNTDYFRVKIKGSERELKAIIDTGAFAGSFIKKSCLNSLTSIVNFKLSDKVICSALNECKHLSEIVNATLQLFYYDMIIELNVSLYVVEDLSCDVILGLDDIRKHELSTRLADFFTGLNSRHFSNELGRGGPDQCSQNQLQTLAHCSRTREIRRPAPDDSEPRLTRGRILERGGWVKPIAEQWGYLDERTNLGNRYERNLVHSLTSYTGGVEFDTHSKGIRMNKDTVIDIDPDDDESDEYFVEHEMELGMGDDPDQEDVISLITFAGTDQFKSEAKKLCTEYRDVFRTTVAKQAALIPPLELEVNEEKWHVPRNTMAARKQTEEKSKAIHKFLEKGQELDIIEPCQGARYWSQVHMVPKGPPDNWRFCIDFVNLNTALKGMHWPIPNIRVLLQRLGDARSDVFGVFDLTAGYHQVNIAANARDYTAFMTHWGLFRWKRIPMGIKTAPSYFQFHMGATVLQGLLYHICELYVDDIILHAKTEKEFLENLRTLLQRLRDRRVYISPKKCMIGVKEVEYVGYVVDKTGTTFSKEKREKVLNFKLPMNLKELKSFIGLVTYFKDHVPHFTERMAPLYALLPRNRKYNPGEGLKWTPQLEQHFIDTQKAVSLCPKLYFLTTGAPIIVMTDASGYGVGGYVYQLVEGVELPISFVSKTLSAQQKVWDTREREAYAIFYTLRTLDYILRDVKFTLRTDHRNLTFMNEEMNAKVKRWKLAIQHFDFDIEHVPGKDNPVADAFSRLVDPGELPPKVELNSLHNEVPQHYIKPERYKVIEKVHNSLVGHHGVELTMRKLRTLLKSENQQPWKSMTLDVRTFVRQCPMCQKMSQLRIPIVTKPYVTASYNVMDRLNIDTIGPLPTAVGGEKYILTVIDCFSRFTVLYALKDKTAVGATQALVQHIGMFGIPAQIVVDNGTQFANELVRELCEVLTIDLHFIQAYSHEENAIVERANKEVMRHLRAFTNELKQHGEWPKFLPLAQRIMNSMVHSSTGVSPAELLYGNNITLDRTVFDKGNIPKEESYSEYMTQMFKCQSKLLRLAQQNQWEKDMHHMGTRPEGDFTEFPINSWVLVEYESDGHRPPHKLNTRWRGPYKVVSCRTDEKTGQVIYTTQNPVTKKLEDHKIYSLRPFAYDPVHTDPGEVTQQDQEYFGIDDILEHRKTGKSARALEFLVQWTGYDEPTWEPWHGVFKTEQVHNYLRRKNMSSLIPQQYR